MRWHDRSRIEAPACGWNAINDCDQAFVGQPQPRRLRTTLDDRSGPTR